MAPETGKLKASLCFTNVERGVDLELENWLKIEKSKFGDTLLPLSRDKISKLETFHGNGLHLGLKVLEIHHLDAETEP